MACLTSMLLCSVNFCPGPPICRSDHNHETGLWWKSLHPYDTLHRNSICLSNYQSFYLTWTLIFLSCDQKQSMIEHHVILISTDQFDAKFEWDDFILNHNTKRWSLKMISTLNIEREKWNENVLLDNWDKSIWQKNFEKFISRNPIYNMSS